MNIFRILADLSHTASKVTLIYAIHRNSSAEGVSLLTQLLYVLVFCTRYLDLFWVSPAFSLWNFFFKLFYISSSFYVVYLMMRVYPRTREKEGAWKITIWALGLTVVSAPLVTLVFNGWMGSALFAEVLWTFSIELESVCVLPQLQLLRQTSVPTVLDSYYLVTLGSYRLFYIINWIFRGATERYWEPVAFIFGVIQTLLYIDFAWVYYSRQRVKLRGGGVVDSDDLSKSFLVRRFIGNGRRSQDNQDDITEEDEALAGQENGTIRPSASRAGSNWGRRGISVSADNTLDHHHHGADIDASEIADPAAFEDESDDDNDNSSSSSNNHNSDAPVKQLKASGPTSPSSSSSTNNNNTTTTTTTTTDSTAAWAMDPTRQDAERD